MDDVEGLVEVLTVIPSLVDHHELRVFPAVECLGGAAGGMRTVWSEKKTV